MRCSSDRAGCRGNLKQEAKIVWKRSLEEKESRNDFNVPEYQKSLFNFEPPVTEDEIRASTIALTVCAGRSGGFNKPSKANEAAFSGCGG